MTPPDPGMGSRVGNRRLSLPVNLDPLLGLENYRTMLFQTRALMLETMVKMLRPFIRKRAERNAISPPSTADIVDYRRRVFGAVLTKQIWGLLTKMWTPNMAD